MSAKSQGPRHDKMPSMRRVARLGTFSPTKQRRSRPRHTSRAWWHRLCGQPGPTLPRMQPKSRQSPPKRPPKRQKTSRKRTLSPENHRNTGDQPGMGRSTRATPGVSTPLAGKPAPNGVIAVSPRGASPHRARGGLCGVSGSVRNMVGTFQQAEESQLRGGAPRDRN